MKTSSMKSLKGGDDVKVSKGGDDGNSSWNENEWVTSGLLFGLWAGLMYYVFQLAPNQTLYQYRPYQPSPTAAVAGTSLPSSSHYQHAFRSTRCILPCHWLYWHAIALYQWAFSVPVVVTVPLLNEYLNYWELNMMDAHMQSQDTYFLQKLLKLRGDDGFAMNGVLVALWYSLCLWPLLYSMLLLPTAKSSRSKVPLWPFLSLSFSVGAYALIPYFVLWKPPPPSPPIQKQDINKWPLNFLESKITAAIALGAGLGLIGYAALGSGDAWNELFQYFRESLFIHAMIIDFILLSIFAPFWVYNDVTARGWISKGGSWLVPVALIPLVGPAFYILLRPSLSSLTKK